MNNRPVSGEDVLMLNEYIASADERLSSRARRKLVEYVQQPECFVDANVREWARRIVNRVNRVCQGGQASHS